MNCVLVKRQARLAFEIKRQGVENGKDSSIAVGSRRLSPKIHSENPQWHCPWHSPRCCLKLEFSRESSYDNCRHGYGRPAALWTLWNRSIIECAYWLWQWRRHLVPLCSGPIMHDMSMRFRYDDAISWGLSGMCQFCCCFNTAAVCVHCSNECAGTLWYKCLVLHLF